MEYHYRVQGTAADGTIYISEDMTFHTLLAEETAEVNLASLDEGARVIAVSSNFGGGANDAPWGANYAGAGDVFGPFVLGDAEKIYRFDVDITTQLLRVNVVDSSGGNTGLVEFGAYGDQLED